MNHQASDAAAAANRTRYGDGEIVTQYSREPYHALRIAIAADLMIHYMKAVTTEPRIADLAAGGPQFARRATRPGMKIACCDTSSATLTTCARAGCAAVRFDVTRKFPFLPHSLDGIFAGEIIEHLFDPAAFLHECHSSLRTGGLLIITTPNLATAQDRMRFLFGLSPRQIDPYHEYLKLHIRPFTTSALKAMLRKEGFLQIAIRSNYVRWYRAGSFRQSRLLARLRPTLGGSLIIAGKAQ
jgi:2-polyprenyl-3-methyl-5-hydroxy-6-metoxy-1,4-benzoquinol methylase